MSSALPEELLPFLRESVGEGCEVVPLLGDASTRGYFRLSTPAGKRYMLAYYPEATRADVSRFLLAYNAISGNTRVPVVHFHGAAGIVQEDVGDETIFEVVKRDHDRGVALYHDAIDLLVDFQRSPVVAQGLNPPFNETKFSEELEMTRKYFVEELAGVRSALTLERLRRVLTELSHRLTEHPYVLCHRDYHGQNIHVFQDTLYMIDYQDMRMGPDTYDLASLLRDRGMARELGYEVEESLVEYYRNRLGAGPDLRTRYLETLLQRSVKVLGTFARQALERGRTHYLEYIPPALDSVRFCLQDLPQFAELAQLLPLDYEVSAASSTIPRASHGS